MEFVHAASLIFDDLIVAVFQPLNTPSPMTKRLARGFSLLRKASRFCRNTRTLESQGLSAGGWLI
jgi:hypothetical protein